MRQIKKRLLALVCALALGPFVAFFTRYAAEAMVFGRASARARRETSP